MLLLTLLVKMFTFPKGFLMTVTIVIVDHIKLILVTKTVVYVVIIL